MPSAKRMLMEICAVVEAGTGWGRVWRGDIGDEDDGLLRSRWQR